MTFLVIPDANKAVLNTYVFFQVSGFNLSGIQFLPGPLGLREILIRFRNLTDLVRIEVVAGAPTKLMIVGWDVTRVSPVCLIWLL